MLINESVLRRIIREELARHLNETTTLRRRAGETSGGVRRETDDVFRRREVKGIDDVIFDPRRDSGPGSPFIGGTEAFEKTYNNGKLRVPLVLKKHVPGGIEKFMIFVDAPAIKEDDIVIVPELFDSGELGAGVVTSIRQMKTRDRNGNIIEAPVASIQFPPEARKSGVGGTIQGVGLAFLVRLGSFKTESGREKMSVNNRMRASYEKQRREEPRGTVKYSSGLSDQSQDRRTDRDRANMMRDEFGLKRR